MFTECHECIYWKTMAPDQEGEKLRTCTRYPPRLFAELQAVERLTGRPAAAYLYRPVRPMTGAAEGCGEGYRPSSSAARVFDGSVEQ